MNLIEKLDHQLNDATELFELAESEHDQALLNSVSDEIASITAEIEKLEFQRMFSQEMDPNNAFLDVQSGSGGTEVRSLSHPKLDS